MKVEYEYTVNKKRVPNQHLGFTDEWYVWIDYFKVVDGVEMLVACFKQK